jgi:hypothetical protein
MYLHDDKAAFRAAVLSCADSLDMPPAYVAKDYFIVLMLKEITGRNPNVVFKGGTSLSKCHNAIDRFSEDIDLGLEAAHATEGMRKRMKGCVVDSADAVGLAIENLDQTRSKREFNKFIVPLPVLGESPVEPLIVETAVITPASPAEKMPIRMFLREWADAEGVGDGLGEYEGTEPFELLVNSKERTFSDKVFAICDYYLDDAPIPERQSRHIYDLYKLLQLIDMDDDLVKLILTVRSQRLGKNRCPSAEAGVSVADTIDEIVHIGAYEDDYVNVTSKLLYEAVPYKTAVVALSEISDCLRENGI